MSVDRRFGRSYMIGRKQEVKELNRLYNRNKAELVAIYGRRRVGKTYLVDETFEGKITFRHAGLSPADENSKGLLRLQLDHFYNSLNVQGMEKCEKPKNWLDAFVLLEKFLQNRDDGSRHFLMNCRGWIHQNLDLYEHLKHFGILGDVIVKI